MKQIGNYLFFGGDGSFLSNFYNGKGSIFRYENLMFTSTEQAFQYAKAKYFKDTFRMERIYGCSLPIEAKMEGRLIKNFVPEEWDQVKVDIMREILALKFEHHNLKKQLLDTKNLKLVEANTGDHFWGFGGNDTDTNAILEDSWKGQNMLGQLLMELRETLKNQDGS